MGKKEEKSELQRHAFQLKSSILIQQSIRVRETFWKRKPACFELRGMLPDKIKALKLGGVVKYGEGFIYAIA